MTPPHTAFRADRVLSRGLSVFFRNLGPFLLLTALVYSPLVVYAAVAFAGDLTADSAMRVFYAITYGSMIAQMLASGAVTHGTIAQLRGQRATTAQSLSVALRRAIPILGVGILAGLAMMVGFLLLVVPGVMLMCKYWVAEPVTVVERLGVTASMRRSAELVKGHGWSVLAIALVLFLLAAGLNQALQQTLDVSTLTVSELKIFLVSHLFTSVLTTAASATIVAVSYHDLRVAKEEISAEEIARAVLVK